MDVLQIVRDRIKKKYAKKPKPAKTIPKGQWTCNQCRLSFNSEKEFKKHKRQYHKLKFGMR